MSRLHPALALVAVLALALTAVASAKKHAATLPGTAHETRDKTHPKGAVGEYDYFVMALSWSPTYCQTHPDEDEQCGHKGYGFILHGLWPQYEGGGGPERCVSDDEPDRRTIAQTLAFMPSRRLINHEWRAHGACTGLDPKAYFDLADHAFAKIHVPALLSAPREPLQMTSDNLRSALRAENPALGDDMLSLHCSQGELVEVRFCLDRQLNPRRCGKRMRNGCPASAAFSIPAAN